MENDIIGAREINRRTIIKGAAWSVPVIVAASAVPLASASAQAGNLKAEAVNCDLLTLNIAGSSIPGFKYTVTEGTIKAGTEIIIDAGGLANVDIGSFSVTDSASNSGTTGGISLLFLGGKQAKLTLLRDYQVGEWIQVGINGVNVAIVGRYTTSIVTPDTNLNDQNAGFTAGGVGVLGALGAWICFKDSTQKIDPVDLTPVDLKITSKCPTILGGAPRFEIGVNGAGTIPAGTKFLLFSNAVANINFGSWTWQGGGSSGAANMIDLLGLGGAAKIIEIPRDVTAATPIELVAQGIGVNAGVNARLAFVGTDADQANNAAGVNFTGITVGGLFAGSCQTV